MKKIKLFELFSGIGAQHKAFNIINGGGKKKFEVVGTSEWDVKAILAYYKIHHNGIDRYPNKTKEWLLEEIERRGYVFSNDGETEMKKRALHSKKRDWLSLLLSACVKNKNYGSIMDLNGTDLIQSGANLVTYSFPCQDLSTGSQFTKAKTGLQGKRSGLLYQVERILDEVNEEDSESLPEFLLLENVQQLIKNEVFFEEYKVWENKLSELGYVSKVLLMNALDVGMPQSRKRVFVLSSRVHEKQELPNENEIIDIYNEKFQYRSRTLNEIIIKDKYEVEQVMSMTKPTPSREMMRRKVPKLLETRFTHTNTLTKKQDRTPCPGTINMSDRPEILKMVEKYRPDFAGYNYYYRFLTPRETFKLMGFDDKDFNNVSELNYGVRAYYAMSGNSIVTNNLLPIFSFIIEEWERYNE